MARTRAGEVRHVSRYQRWNALLDLLPGDGQLTVAQAAAALGVSQATIRRDLDQLAQQQLITRTRGGAVAGHVSYDLPLRYKTARHAPQKQRIGRAAAALIGPGATVALNGGTTTSEVARALATRPDLQDGTGSPAITVVTNAMNIANELAVRQHLKIVVTGGVTRGQSYELIGPLATLVLAELTLDWAILGVDALDPRAGATAHHEGEASINHLMASRAEHVMIVADSSKLGQRAFARVCATEEIDVIVTDHDAPPDSLTPFTERGIRVITALEHPLRMLYNARISQY
ncbi:MAG TPA: DeoR/GlpR family DNA-binding transcription regulator [Streptosporangiaceae bacterium]|jgi:DeoR family transcriptional regulator of aga operon|nr:DeoR/GlpR family DNA-binding transcription regulator [Streptosporangiaceae bacterium]